MSVAREQLCGYADFREMFPRMEAGSNTSTVVLRVVGGDEEGAQCLGV
jgi:hypothetical protein